MKNEIFHITFGTVDDMLDGAEKALKTGKGSSYPAAMFSDLNEFMGFMFPGKFTILMAIKSQEPSSMYDLAQKVSRAQSGVLKDCKELEAMGFITLSKEGVRNSMKPRLAFPYESIVVHLNNNEQSVFSLPNQAEAA